MKIENDEARRQSKYQSSNDLTRIEFSPFELRHLSFS